MKTLLIILLAICGATASAQTNRNGKPVNPTQPDTNRPNTTVTPNAQVPVTPRTNTNTNRNTTTTTTNQTVNAIRSSDTMTPAGTVQRPVKNDTKPSTVNGNANVNQHVTTPGNTKIDKTEVDHTQPSGTQRVDGTTITPPKK